MEDEIAARIAKDPRIIQEHRALSEALDAAGITSMALRNAISFSAGRLAGFCYQIGVKDGQDFARMEHR